MSLVEVQLTASVNVTATSSATGTTLLTTGSFTVENGGVFYVDVWVPFLTKGTTNVDIELFEGASAAAGTFLTTLSGHLVADGARPTSWTVRRTLTPGAHQLTVTGFVDAGTGVFGAGLGTTGAFPNAWMRVRPA
jgi:hypothetical protein